MKNITENNKLIAEFMEKDVAFADTSEPCIIVESGVWSPMKYHKSWDWLMPVVEKIENLGFNISIDSRIDENLKVLRYTFIIGCHSEFDTIENKRDSSINNTYKSVIEFINWYNENK